MQLSKVGETSTSTAYNLNGTQLQRRRKNPAPTTTTPVSLMGPATQLMTQDASNTPKDLSKIAVTTIHVSLPQATEAVNSPKAHDSTPVRDQQNTTTVLDQQKHEVKEVANTAALSELVSKETENSELPQQPAQAPVETALTTETAANSQVDSVASEQKQESAQNAVEAQVQVTDPNHAKTEDSKEVAQSHDVEMSNESNVEEPEESEVPLSASQEKAQDTINSSNLLANDSGASKATFGYSVNSIARSMSTLSLADAARDTTPIAPQASDEAHIITVQKPQSHIETALKAFAMIKNLSVITTDESFDATPFVTLENALGAIQKEAQLKFKKLEPFDAECYKKHLDECLEQARKLHQNADNLRTNLEMYEKTVNVTTSIDNLLEKCKGFIEQYHEQAEHIWDLKQRIEEHRKVLEAGIKKSTFHPHSERAKDTNFKLGYISSITQDNEDQNRLVENRKKYEGLLSSFNSDLATKEWYYLQQSINTIFGTLNKLCYNYEYKKKYNTLPSSLSLSSWVSSIPPTVINPFAVESKSANGFIAKDKQEVYFASV